jgi:hypothetical protein
MGALSKALTASIKLCGGPSKGDLDTLMRAVVVDRTAVAIGACYNGNKLGDRWPGSRAITIEEADTAKAFSLQKIAYWSANLSFGTQPVVIPCGPLQISLVDDRTVYAGYGGA